MPKLNIKMICEMCYYAILLTILRKSKVLLQPRTSKFTPEGPLYPRCSARWVWVDRAWIVMRVVVSHIFRPPKKQQQQRWNSHRNVALTQCGVAHGWNAVLFNQNPIPLVFRTSSHKILREKISNNKEHTRFHALPLESLPHFTSYFTDRGEEVVSHSPKYL